MQNGASLAICALKFRTFEHFWQLLKIEVKETARATPEVG